jgi:phenylacetate-CoA ligase
MLVSENVHEFQMDLFRRVFKCPVLKHYGHSERILMAATMPGDDRYFFWPQYGWFELLDFENKPITRPGVLGQIVGTSFDNLVMPFVRYCTGDLAVLSDGGHAQLPGYAACERIEGRLQEFIVDRYERLISLIAVGSAHFPWFSLIDELQYEQERPGEIIMKFVASNGFSADMQQRMAHAVGQRTCCNVLLARVNGIERTPRGKQSLLVQKLDIHRYIRSAPSVLTL